MPVAWLVPSIDCVISKLIDAFIEDETTNLEHDADSQVHERLGEIDDTFAGVVNCHTTDGQIGFLLMTK